ncbi:MAG TPA: sulfotransferase [Polyangia bacterium]
MSELRVVGAGLGRTGTFSLKLALERLLGGPCYHMKEVFDVPAHIPVWHAALKREPVDFRKMLDGYAAAVDWPASAFWPELSDTFPNALIVLSLRDPDSWWRSATRTIFEGFRKPPAPGDNLPWRAMVTAMLETTFTPNFLDEAAAKAAFARHIEVVRQAAPASRLVEWRAEDGWGPLCAALGLPIPSEPFPHANTTEEFRARAKLDA